MKDCACAVRIFCRTRMQYAFIKIDNYFMIYDTKSIIKKHLPTIVVSAVVSTGVFVVGGMLVMGFFVFGKGVLPHVALSNGTASLASVGATGNSSVVDIVKKSNPAVVAIVITKDVPVMERYYENDPFSGGLGDFFGNIQIPQYRQNGTKSQEVGGGSGFFVSSDGLLVTNRHVVDDPSADYTVFTTDGKKHTAKVLAKDSSLDIALLKVEGSGFPYLEFGDSNTLSLGQSVIAIGNALGEFRNSVSVGVVSGLARSVVAGDSSGNAESLEGVIQTDAAINPGNSGGPLLDLSGHVIGVNVAVAQGSENISFALPSTTVKSIVDSVKAHGEIVRPYLGLRYVQINDDLKQKNGLSVNYGVLVTRGDTQADLAVIPGSPADKAGVVENDIILEIDGIKLDEGTSLSSIVRQKQVGDTVTLHILHKGTEKDVHVTLEKAPASV